MISRTVSMVAGLRKRGVASRASIGAAILAACALALGVACGDGSESSTPTAASTASSPPIPTAASTASSTPIPAYPAGTTAGIAAVDELIPAVESEDTDFIREHLAYVQVPCGDPGTFSEPQCPAGVAAGTSIEAFPLSGCETTLEAEWLIEPVVEGFTRQSLRLFAVYRVDDNRALAGLPADFGIVFVGTFGGNPPAGPAMFTYFADEDGRIVLYTSSCDVVDPYEYLEDAPVSEYILPPIE